MLWRGRNTASKCLPGVLAVSQPHWICPRSQRVCFPSLHCSGSRLLCWELSEAGPAFRAFPRSKLSGSGSQVLHKGADLVGPAFCALPGPSSSGDQVLGERSWSQLKAVTYRLPRPSHSVFWVYNGHAFSGVPCAVCLFWGADLCLQLSQRMLTIQNPKKSWLAMTSACSLV